MKEKIRKRLDDLWKVCMNSNPQDPILIRAGDLAEIIMEVTKENDDDKQ